MEYKLQIKERTEELQKEIITMYWTLDSSLNWKYLVNDITTKYNLTSNAILKIIHSNSTMLLQNRNCDNCNTILWTKMSSRSTFMEAKRDMNKNQRYSGNYKPGGQYYCSDCKLIIDKRKEEQERKTEILLSLTKIINIEEKLQKSYQNKLYTLLDEIELDILKQIIIIKDRNKIFATIFKQSYSETWKIVNKLEKYGTLHVIREDNTVVNFVVLEELKETLLPDYKKENLQNINFTDKNILDKNIYSNNLSFSITTNNKRKNIDDPHYSGEFILPNNVILKKGTRYIYSGQKLTDGSIHVRFIPVSNDIIKDSKEN